MAFLAAVPVLAAVTAAAAAAGTAVTAASAIHQGNVEQATANYNAQVEAQRAGMAQQAAAANAQLTQQSTERKLGEAAAAYGASGLDSQGTPLAVMSDLATQGEVSRQLQLYRGKTEGQAATQQGALDTAGGAAAAAAGLTKGGGTLLTGASSTAKNLQPYFSSPDGSGSSPARST